MKLTAVKFNVKDRPEFTKELRSRVNQYFKDNNISKHANFNMKFKTAFMLSLYTIPLVLVITGAFPALWVMYLLWAVMGFGMSGIGLSIMHDANHGSYSSNQKVNNALGFLLNYVGGYHINWKIQHNVLHHSFTNVEGYDEDIDNNVLRFSPATPLKKWYRFQAFYAPFFYGLMTFYWVVSKDFEQVVRYEKKGLLAAQKLTLRKAVLQVAFNKLWYLLMIIGLPMVFSPFAWYHILLGWFLMHFIAGLVLAFIFQPAHILGDTEYFRPDENGSVENNWVIHQLLTTANFANKSIFFSWFVGGLNFQVEHHLFPNICHVHYKKLSPIVKQTAEEYGVPYYQHKTFFGALKSHFQTLNELGTGQYDKKMAKAA